MNTGDGDGVMDRVGERVLVTDRVRVRVLDRVADVDAADVADGGRSISHRYRFPTESDLPHPASFTPSPDAARSQQGSLP